MPVPQLNPGFTPVLEPLGAGAARQTDALVQDHGLYLSASVLQRVRTVLTRGGEQLLG